MKVILPKAFPKKSQLPPSIEIPKIHGRILVDGKIIDSGFNTKPVLSPCSLQNETDEGLYFPEIGTTPQIDSAAFMAAADAATRAWAKGLGAWPSARMEERIAAVTAFREQMVLKRDLVCRLLMWEIAKSWKDSQAEF